MDGVDGVGKGGGGMEVTFHTLHTFQSVDIKAMSGTYVDDRYVSNNKNIPGRVVVTVIPTTQGGPDFSFQNVNSVKFA